MAKVAGRPSGQKKLAEETKKFLARVGPSKRQRIRKFAVIPKATTPTKAKKASTTTQAKKTTTPAKKTPKASKPTASASKQQPAPKQASKTGKKAPKQEPEATAESTSTNESTNRRLSKRTATMAETSAQAQSLLNSNPIGDFSRSNYKPFDGTYPA